VKIKKLNSDKLINFNPSKYRIDWDGREISKPQTLVRNFLRPYWQHYDVYSELVIPGSRLRCDFFNASLGIVLEVSPDELHAIYTPFLHKSRPGFLKKLKSDISKMTWCEANDFLFVELNTADLKQLSPELFASKGLIL